MKVSDLMVKNLICVNFEEPIVVAARLLTKYNLGILPVCDDEGLLIGILSDRDIVTRCISNSGDVENTKVCDVMSKNLSYLSPDDDIKTATNLMSRSKIRRIPVVTEGNLVGLISLSDIARHSDIEAAAALAEISMNIVKL